MQMNWQEFEAGAKKLSGWCFTGEFLSCTVSLEDACQFVAFMKLDIVFSHIWSMPELYFRCIDKSILIAEIVA